MEKSFCLGDCYMWFFLAFLLGFSFLFSLPTGGPQIVGLQECYELAVMKSETLGMKASEIKVQEALYWQAISTAFPQIHAKATPTWEDQSYGQNLSRSNSSLSTASRKVPTMDSWEGKITVAQPIFRGFREFSAASAAKEGQTAKGFELKRSREVLYEEVAGAFYQWIQYEEDLKLILELQTTLSQRVTEMENRVKLGKSRPSELIAVRSDLAESRVNEQQTRALFQATKEILAFLIALPSRDIQIKKSEPQWDVRFLEDYLKEIEYRPDYLAALAEERAARKKVDVVRAEHLPTVDLSADYSLRQEPRTKGDWKVLLTMDLPIFEGGIVEARIKEQKALLQQNQLQIERLKRTVDQEIRTRFSNFNYSSLERIRLHEWVALAEENYLLQKNDYEKGVASQLEVIDSLRKWTEAKRRYSALVQENQFNWVRLHVAGGLSSFKP